MTMTASVMDGALGQGCSDTSRRMPLAGRALAMSMTHGLVPCRNDGPRNSSTTPPPRCGSAHQAPGRRRAQRDVRPRAPLHEYADRGVRDELAPADDDQVV